MPIDVTPADPKQAGGYALFLFAHQDDEFGVFHAIEACRRQGLRVVCAYFTRGAGELGQRRNAESCRVLAQLGVAVDDIVFAGDRLGIDDASLPAHLEQVSEWLPGWAASLGRIDLVYVTAWEGGHHDHDALHAVALDMAERLGLLDKVRQYSLYNRYRCTGAFFNVLTPLAANGPVQHTPIPWHRRLAYLRLCLSYPSQLVTWVGLFPFVLLHYLFRGTQAVQAVLPERTLSRPHEGTLYYEHRGFYQWEQMERRLGEWRSKRRR